MAFFGNKRKDFSIQPPRQQVDGTPFFVTDSANIDFTLENLNLTANLTPTGVTAGTYGSSTRIPILQVDQWGRITGVTTTTFSAAGISLETNGTPNPVQTLLNLVAGTNMTITDDGAGNITFDATGGGGTVNSVNSGININVDNTDPANPIVNSLSDRYKTSSTTSNSVSNGTKTFTVDANLSYIPLQEVLVVHNSTNHMHGEVVSYSGTTLVVDIKTHTGSGTYTSWVINLDGTPVDALTGSGTANEIAYFTAARILASLPVSIYPSLTELSYVKGVSSAIQTQINSKQNSLTTTKSVKIVSNNVELDGDDASPGNSKYYGTDISGTKGFHSLPGAFPEYTVYPYQRTPYAKVSDAFSCVYNNNNILFLGGSSNNQILVVDTNTADTLLTSAFDRPTGFFPIDDIGTPEMWAVSLTLTTIRRFNLSTGSLIATTAPTGVVTNASSSRFVSYDSTKAIAANTVNLYTINPSTFVTSNLTAHGVGGRAFIAINKNAASAQNGTVMFVGDNGVGLFDCTTNTISLAVSTLGGIVDNCHDVIYCPINDYWIVVAVVGGTIRIVYLRPLTATTFTVVNTITTAFIYANISLSNVFTTNQIKIQVDETLDFLFYATTSRLLIYRLSTGQLLNSISLSMLGGGSQQQSLSIDTVNKRLFFCTGGSTSLSITQELIYAP